MIHSSHQTAAPCSRSSRSSSRQLNALLPGWRRCVAAAAHRRAVACASSSRSQQQQQQTYQLLEERGVEFTPGDAFYRAESAQGRDLAVLAAAVYRKQHGHLRVLDAMAGSGMRGARYIHQAGADLVWSNDYDRRNSTALVFNLVNALQHSNSSSSSNSGSNTQQQQQQPLSRSSGSDGRVEESVRQWTAEAQALQYEGIRGAVLQWQQQQQQQQEAHQHLQPYEQQQQQQATTPGTQQQAQHEAPTQQQDQQQQQDSQQQRVRVTHVEARRLLASVYLQEDYFDLVDVDSFGSDTSYLAGAIDALKYGGMLYLTSTDGMSAGGKRPQRSLAAYGSYLRALPSANEQGLRMLIGAAVREGAARGVALTPLFSLYSYHGPVFRVMLRASRSGQGLDLRQYSYVGHCYVHGENYRVGWRGLSQAWCRCQQDAAAAAGASAGDAAGDAAAGDAAAGDAAAVAADQLGQTATLRPTPLVLSGPMWTGPLHETGFVSSMSELAAEWGWLGSAVPSDSPYVVRQSKNNRQRPLEELLQLLWEESSPELPPWFITINTLAQHLSTTPSRDKLVAALRARGYTACCCHVEQRALRTNATTAQVLRVAVEDCGYSLRPGVPQVLLQHHAVVELSC